VYTLLYIIFYFNANGYPLLKVFFMTVACRLYGTTKVKCS